MIFARAAAGYGRFSTQLQEKYAGEMPERAQHYVARIQHNAQQMGLLIDDLLMLSRLGRKTLEARHTSLRQLVEEILHELNVEEEYPQAIIHVGDLPGTVVDRTLMKQVYLDLIGNALKFSKQIEAPDDYRL